MALKGRLLLTFLLFGPTFSFPLRSIFRTPACDGRRGQHCRALTGENATHVALGKLLGDFPVPLVLRPPCRMWQLLLLETLKPLVAQRIRKVLAAAPVST